MQNEQKRVHDWMARVGQNTPDRPEMPEQAVCILRLKLIAEELLELADAFGCKMTVSNSRGKNPKLEITPDPSRPALNFHDLVSAYDAVNDLLVVVLGTAVAMGTECHSGFNEVMDSNDSKLIDGRRRADGKWVKGPLSRPPVLAPILQAQLAAAHNRDRQTEMLKTLP